MSNWKVIGISGVTCAGKSSLAEKLVDEYSDCLIVNQDQYYRSEDDPNHEWLDLSSGHRHQNWESMASMDWTAFTRAIHNILESEPRSGSGMLIIEGHLIFNYKPISDLCQKKYFLTLEKDECFTRRDRRSYLPKDPNGYFEEWVWPMYLSNLNQIKAIQSSVQIEYLDGMVDQNTIFDYVMTSLELFTVVL